MSGTCNVQVAIRVRRLIQKELQHAQKSYWTIKDNSICCEEAEIGRKPTPYIFDRIFDEQNVTLDVFEDLCKPIVVSALEGFHGTIFAYGQSSSGKTFTMSGTKMQPGVISLAVEEIFRNISNIEHKEFLIRVGYMEIYNEQVTDLLSAEENILKIREDSAHNIQISGLTEEIVNSLDQVRAVIKRGDARRHTAETKQNDRSSRSHCILRFVIESKTMNADDEPVNVSHLHFVDLAGSEKAAENTGDRFKEGCAINKSLFTLGNVIRKLSGDENMSHVSFRDSKLTRLLTNALGGNSKTAIICTITPASIDESDSTLKFASRAKVIKNKPEVNEVMTDAALLKKYRREINMLQSKMKELSNTDMHMEKAELEKKLMEKEDIQHKQAQLIQNLQKMVVISGAGNSQEPPKKKRRETWCPGKGARSLAREPGFLPILEETSPQEKKTSLETAISVKLSKTVPSVPPNIPPDLDTSLQLLDNIPAYKAAAEDPFENTINANPYIKDLFELQDKHEILLEEMKKKEIELEELRDFTELERQCEKETITSLKEQLHSFESNFPWLEDELMKTQQERNKLRAELESRNRQLSAVEDGTGLTERNKQLSDAESKVANLCSEIDLQKSRYEFHIAQMKSKLELFTQLLEENGVDPERIKQKTGGDVKCHNEVDEMADKHEQEVNDLRNEIDSYIQRLEQEQAKHSETIQHYESKFEHQKEVYKKDLKEVEDEREVFRQMFEEEMAKKNENLTDSSSSLDIDAVKQKYDEEINELKSKLEAHVELLETEKLKCKELSDSERDNAIEDLKQEHENEVTNLKKQLENYVELLNVEKTKPDKTDDTETGELKSETESLKLSQENEIRNLKLEVDRYKKLVDDKNQRCQENTVENVENDAFCRSKYEEEIRDLKAEVDKYVELLHAEREKSDAVASKDMHDEGIEAAFRSEIDSLKKNHFEEIQCLKEEISEYEKIIVNDKKKNTEIKGEIETHINEIKFEMEKIKHNDELIGLRTEVEKCMHFLNARKEIINGGSAEEKDDHADMEQMKQKYETEIRDLTAELEQYKELVDADRECLAANESMNINSEQLRTEYELRIKNLEEDLETYKELLIEKENKNIAKEIENKVSIETAGENNAMEIENDVSIDTGGENNAIGMENDISVVNFLENHKQSFTAGDNMDLQAELLKAQQDVVDSSQESDLASEMHVSEIKALKQTHDAELDALRDELQRYKELLEIEQKKTSNISEGETREIPALETEFAIEASCQTVDTLRSDLEKHAQLLEEMKLKYGHLEEEQREERVTFDQQRLVYENTVKDTEEQLHSVRSAAQTLSTEIENLQNAYQSLKKDKMKLVNEKSDLEDEVERLKQPNLATERTDNELEPKESDTGAESLCLKRQTQELTTEVESLNKINSELENKCRQLNLDVENFKSANQCLEEECQQLVGKIDSLSEHSASLEVKTEELGSEIEKLQNMNQCFEESSQELSAKVDYLNEVNCAYEEKSQALSKEVERLTTECQELSQELQKENDKKQELLVEVQRIEEHNNQLQKEKDSTSHHEKEVGSEIVRLEALKASMEKRSQELEAEVERLEDQTKTLRDENAVLIKQKGEMQAGLDSLETVNSSLNVESKKLVAQVESLATDNDTLREEKEEAERKVEVWDETLVELKAELQLLEEENMTLKNTLQQKTSDVSNTDSELKFLKTHVEELEDDAKVSAELIAEYDTEIRQLREKLTAVEAVKTEYDEKVENYEQIVIERDNLAEKLSRVESDLKEDLENCRSTYEETLAVVRETNTNLNNKISHLENEIKDFKEQLNSCTSDRDCLQKEIRLLNEERVKKEILEEIRQRLKSSEVENDKLRRDLEQQDDLMSEVKELKQKLQRETERRQNVEEALERAREEVKQSDIDEKLMELHQKTNEASVLQSDLEDERKAKEKLQKTVDELEKTLAETRNESVRMDHGATEAAILKLKSAEAELDRLRTTTSKLETEKLSAEKLVEELKEQKISIEEDLYQIQNNKPINSLRINTVERFEDWENKWDQFVKEEKRKRYGLLLEMRDLKKELQTETERRENAFEEALESAREEVRKSDMYNKLRELYKKTDDEANVLHSKLEDEKIVSEKLKRRNEELEKTSAEMRKNLEELRIKEKSATGSGFVEGTHSCNYKLEAFSLQRQMKEKEEQFDKRVAEYKEAVQMKETRIHKLKTEIRSLQSMDCTINVNSMKQPDFTDSSPSSAKKPKTDVSGCGSSSSGGIIDHFKAVVIETENKRLKKENEKQASKLEIQAEKLAKYEKIEKEKISLEKENFTLKEELKKASETKKKNEDSGPVSEPRNPLMDFIPKAGSTTEFHSESSTRKRKPRFEIPDLEPKEPDGRFMVDGEDFNEKVDNCKAQ